MERVWVIWDVWQQESLKAAAQSESADVRRIDLRCTADGQTGRQRPRWAVQQTCAFWQLLGQATASDPEQTSTCSRSQQPSGKTHHAEGALRDRLEEFFYAMQCGLDTKHSSKCSSEKNKSIKFGTTRGGLTFSAELSQGSTVGVTSMKDARDFLWSDRVNNPNLIRHESSWLECVFKLCQFKLSSHFKAFKHNTTGKNSIKHSCAIFWAHREPTCKHRIKLFFVSSCNWTNKYTELCQNTHLGEYPQKILGYVLIERKLSRMQSDVYHYIGSMHCLLKWPCLIYQLLSVSLMLIQVKKTLDRITINIP